MHKLTFNNMQSLIFSGDIHGEFETIVNKLNNYAETVLIVCGDIGMGFYKDEYYLTLFKKLNLKLSKKGNQLVMFRGNHDNPDYFNGSFKTYKHLHLIPDYTVIEITGVANVLCIGGATSVDRSLRINEEARSKRKIYWGNAELPIFDEEKLNEINNLFTNNLQIIATHTCPSFAYPITKQGVRYWIQEDEGLSQTLDYERNIMDEIFSKLCENQHSIIDWYYRHFHEHKLERHHSINFRLCDCGEINEFRNR